MSVIARVRFNVIKTCTTLIDFLFLSYKKCDLVARNNFSLNNVLKDELRHVRLY